LQDSACTLHSSGALHRQLSLLVSLPTTWMTFGACVPSAACAHFPLLLPLNLPSLFHGHDTTLHDSASDICKLTVARKFFFYRHRDFHSDDHLVHAALVVKQAGSLHVARMIVVWGFCGLGTKERRNEKTAIDGYLIRPRGQPRTGLRARFELKVISLTSSDWRCATCQKHACTYIARDVLKSLKSRSQMQTCLAPCIA
jgi:hypothetical protein